MLKVIIAAHQNLYAEDKINPKKKLVFLIRDSKDNKKKLKKIEESLLDKLKQSWDDIANDKASEFADFFETEFIFLSALENENFNNEIDWIRKKIWNKFKEINLL